MRSSLLSHRLQRHPAKPAESAAAKLSRPTTGVNPLWFGPLGPVRSPLAAAPPSRLANDAVVTEDGPRSTAGLGAVAATCGRSSFSPAVPPACHKQRSRAVCSGQPRSLGEGRDAGYVPLAWGTVAARNCMACKGSGVQIPCAPPGTTHRQHSHSGPSVSRLSADHFM